jgi:hypothetical protein
MLAEGARHGVHSDVLPQIAKFFDRAIAAGHGAQDLGAVAVLRVALFERATHPKSPRLP